MIFWLLWLSSGNSSTGFLAAHETYDLQEFE